MSNFTSQHKENKDPSAPQPNNKGKDVLDLQEINIVSLKNSFDALMEKDKIFEVNNETLKASNDRESIVDESDSEKVKNVFVEDIGKPMDDLVDDARKKVEAPPKTTLRKTAERKNRNLIEAARTMLNGLIPSKERIPDISYFHVFGCLYFFHESKDHLGKFDATADDGYFLRYSFVSKASRVFNTRRQQVEETYHVTFDESMEAIRFTNTSKDEIGIDDSSKYPPDEFIHEEDPLNRF
ncbi:hypothetical protein Tco_0483439 [Tanacetum coccineum]